MCTYDYTPYTGCDAGEQHFFIQWVKCNQAVENGRYCSLESSARVEQLRKLSANVLSCPLHGPIAVQQYVLEPANAKIQDEEPKPRARSKARKSSAPSRSRTPARGARNGDAEQAAPQREVRKRRSAREMAAESSDSDSTSSLSRRRTQERPKRTANRAQVERRQSRTTRDSHRRSISADVALLPPPNQLGRHGHSEVSLPLKSELEPQEENARSSFARAQPSISTDNLELPRAPGVVGLPSSPDMHRRGSVHRTRSESLLRHGAPTQPEPIQPPATRTALSPSSDSSPDNNPELPFSNNSARRGRRPGPRSVRELSVDTAMKRISEHIVQEEHDELISAAAAAAGKLPPGSSPSTTTTSPEPQHAQPGVADPAPAPAPSRPVSTYTTGGHRRTASSNSHSHSRPRLNNLQIPKQLHAPPQRDAYSAPTATVPESDLTAPGLHTEQRSRSRSRTRSSRHTEVSLSAGAVSANPMPAHALAAYQLGGYDYRRGMNEETASLRSTQSQSQSQSQTPYHAQLRARRAEEQQQQQQGVEARRWAAAREAVPSQVYGQSPAQYHTSPTALTRSPPMGDAARMSEANLAMGGAAAVTGLGVGVGVALPMTAGPGHAGRERESVDSGYRSGHGGYGQNGHGHQRSWETVKSASGSASATSGSVDSIGGGNGHGPGVGIVRTGTPGKAGRNTLQKAPPVSLQQQQQPGFGSPPMPQHHQQRPVPEPLNLAAARLPPCALPVSLMSPLSPGFGQESDGGSMGGKSAKAKLLQRIGLRKKISGLLWERGGREVGVEG